MDFLDGQDIDEFAQKTLEQVLLQIGSVSTPAIFSESNAFRSFIAANAVYTRSLLEYGKRYIKGSKAFSDHKTVVAESLPAT